MASAVVRFPTPSGPDRIRLGGSVPRPMACENSVRSARWPTMSRNGMWRWWAANETLSPGLRRWGATLERVAGSTGLEPAASGVTGRRSNQLNYDPNVRAVYCNPL